jgi:hypothetical protein
MFAKAPPMKKIARLFVLFLITSSVYGLDVYEDISNAIRSNDARQLSGFFGPTLDLTILNQEDVYSKAQAELILKDFFAKNACKSFTILHKGSSKEGTQYAIGTMVTASGKNYRVSFYLKNTAGKIVLQELRIEND